MCNLSSGRSSDEDEEPDTSPTWSNGGKEEEQEEEDGFPSTAGQLLSCLPPTFFVWYRIPPISLLTAPMEWRGKVGSMNHQIVGDLNSGEISI